MCDGRHFLAAPAVARRSGGLRRRRRNRLIRALNCRRRGLRGDDGHNGHSGFMAVAGAHFIDAVVKQRYLAVQRGHAVFQIAQALVRFAQNPLICLGGGFHLPHLSGGRAAADRQNKAGRRNHKNFFHTVLPPFFCPKPLYISRSLAAAAFFRQVQACTTPGEHSACSPDSARLQGVSMNTPDPALSQTQGGAL